MLGVAAWGLLPAAERTPALLQAAGVICLVSLLSTGFPKQLQRSLGCCFPLLLVRALQGSCTGKPGWE